MTNQPVSVAPYTVLAAGYDLVMEHVDYEGWTEYVDHLIRIHKSAERDVRVLELGCGTGSLSLVLHEMGYGRIRGTDRSKEMIDVARRKAEQAGVDIEFEVEDFFKPTDDEQYDVLLLLYDGLNYVTEPDRLPSLFQACFMRLASGGILIFDQSTPANSINNARYFEDEGDEDGFRYIRKSRYDEVSRLHTTTLDIYVGDRVFRETHLQRAYTMMEIDPVVASAGFEKITALDGFSLDEADERSERIHWVVRKQP